MPFHHCAPFVVSYTGQGVSVLSEGNKGLFGFLGSIIGFGGTTQGASTSLWCATSSMLNEIDGVFCENCNVAERKANLDESMLRYFGVADWAIDTDEASKLWDKTEAMLSQ